MLYAQIAQSVEQGTENPRVGGSIPPLGTNFLDLIIIAYGCKFYITLKGSSSAGRTSVSKTGCRGFKSCLPCHIWTCSSGG